MAVLRPSFHPPLACRPSPPQGGRSQVARPLPKLYACSLLSLQMESNQLGETSSGENWGRTLSLADLPPCGGDGRQARGELAAANGDLSGRHQ